MKKSIAFIAIAFLGSNCCIHCRAQSGGIITTVAGTGIPGYSGDDSDAVNAHLSQPSGVAIDAAGNIFIADPGNHAIRKVALSGIITTVAGNDTAGYAGDGLPAVFSELNRPAGVAVDASGNVFISDMGNNVIRRISSGGIVTTYAGNGTRGFSGDGGSGLYAEFDRPGGIAADAAGNLFIADRVNSVIRKISASGVITTVAGIADSIGFSGDGGAATRAKLFYPDAVAVDGAGNLYIADYENAVVRKVDPSGTITTVAGTAGVSGYAGDGGAAIAAILSYPTGLTIDGSGNLFIGSSGIIRKVDPSGMITTYAGNDTAGYSGNGGPATSARLGRSLSLGGDVSGNIFIADASANVVRKISGTLAVLPVTARGNAIRVFPNPNSGIFTIDCAMKGTANNEASVIITDMAGREVHNGKATLLKGTVHSGIILDKGVPGGLYMLSVRSAGESVTSTFTIRK